MEDFVKRILDENNEVWSFYHKTKERLDKLREFLQTEKFESLNETEKRQLVWQEGEMRLSLETLKHYGYALQSRLSYYCPDLDNKEK